MVSNGGSKRITPYKVRIYNINGLTQQECIHSFIISVFFRLMGKKLTYLDEFGEISKTLSNGWSNIGMENTSTKL